MFAKPWVVAVAVLLATSAMLQAQTRRPSMLPAETPPANFEPTQYVDSRGCGFVRAATNGQVTWLPLFGDDRQPVCGLEPSSAAGPSLPARVVVRRTETAPEAEERAEAPATFQPRTERVPTRQAEVAEAEVAETEPPEAEQAETGQAETGRAETGRAEAGRAETRGETPDVAARTPTPEAPVAQAPVVPAPVAEVPVVEAPVAQRQVTETSVAESPMVIIAAGEQRAGPRYTLRVIERRGTIIEVPPDPYARSVLTVIEQRGLLYYPDA